MLSSRDVVKFWIPLSLTWLMMAVEGPVVASVVARMPLAELNLAAHGVAFALAMFIEAPVIHLLGTSVALARSRASFERLRIFSTRINVIVTIGMIAICTPWFFEFITHNLMQLPAEVARLMHLPLMILIPWPAAIGYRRLYQGLLIRNGHTRVVAYGTIVRLVVVFICAVLYSGIPGLDGVVVGAMALVSGVFMEAIVVRLVCRPLLRELAQQKVEDEIVIADAEIMQFWLPLALTSIMGFVVTPIISFFMGHAPDTVRSLAVLPVVDSFVFIFRSFGFSYQEVGIALMGDKFQNQRVVRRVGVWMLVITTSVLGILALTPLLDDVYVQFYGLKQQLADYAVLPTIILIVLPTIAVAYSYYRAILITGRKNVKVTVSTALEVGGITLTMLLLVSTTQLNGALAGAIAMAVGRIAATIYLKVHAGRVLSS